MRRAGYDWTAAYLLGVAFLLVVAALLIWSVHDLRHRVGRDETLLRQLCVASGRGASSVGPLTVRGGKVVAGSTVPARTGCAP